MNQEQRCCLAIVVVLQLAITFYDVATDLYVDGVFTLLPYAKKLSSVASVVTINIPADTRVLAVKVHDSGVSCPLF